MSQKILKNYRAQWWKIATGNVTKNMDRAWIFKILATRNVTKNKEILFLVSSKCTQKLPLKNVTKIQKNSRIITIIITTYYTPPPLATGNVTKN